MPTDNFEIMSWNTDVIDGDLVEKPYKSNKFKVNTSIVLEMTLLNLKTY